MASAPTTELDDLLGRLHESPGALTWLTDLDDTLIDTASMHDAATETMTETLSPLFGQERATSVIARFNDIFHTLVEGHQSTGEDDDAATQLEHRVMAKQEDIRKRWGLTKKFSREVLLTLALEDCGAQLTPTIVSHCADSYWAHMRDHPAPFPEAIEFMRWLSAAGARVYVMTSSDGRFSVHPDGSFTYEPETSRRFKLARLKALRAYGLNFSGAVIGDPVDKPDIAFFQRALAYIEKKEARQVRLEELVIVGDSYKSDLRTPAKIWGTSIRIHLEAGRDRPARLEPNTIRVGTLSQLLPGTGRMTNPSPRGKA